MQPIVDWFEKLGLGQYSQCFGHLAMEGPQSARTVLKLTGWPRARGGAAAECQILGVPYGPRSRAARARQGQAETSKTQDPCF
jgi:hypothetical protein